MSNTRISYTVQADGSADVTVPAALVDDFKVLIARGTSTWQNQDDQIRDFADRVLGRDKYVGKNMKNNFLKDIRTCCNTSVLEPHHTQCPELRKVSKTVFTAKTDWCVKCEHCEDDHPNGVCQTYTAPR